MKGALSDFAAWTPEEDACLRDAYLSGGIALAKRALPERSEISLYHRARRLRLSRRRRWTDSDDKHLADIWEQGLPLRTIARRLERTMKTTYWRAQKIGLPLGCPQGFEYLSAAAKRTGYATSQLWRILAWAKVPVRKTLSRTSMDRVSHHHHVVDPFDVDEAIEAWSKTETAEAAARRLGISGDRLRARLRKVGVEFKRERQTRLTEAQIAAANEIAHWHKRARASGGEG